MRSVRYMTEFRLLYVSEQTIECKTIIIAEDEEDGDGDL